MFLFYEFVCITFFCLAFFFKQEMLWILTLIVSALLMFSSYGIEIQREVLDSTFGVYYTTLVTVSYPYLMGLNLIFFLLALVLAIFDLFEKYGHKIIEREL
jgi:hypothetical protein